MRYSVAIIVSLWLLICTRAIDNGIGRFPPMGWRSWNCFGGDIDQTKMTGIIDALADTSRQVNGKAMSLLEIGYERAGLDDNWQSCGAGINGSFHDAQGHPIVNKQRFPDLKKMSDYAHSKKVKTGWYLNNCICSESGKLQPDWPPQMHGDVDAITEYDFDGVKIDGCGPSHHLADWADLVNKTGKPIMIENCGNNNTFPYWHQNFDYVVCPMNFFRISNDISPNWPSIISNLQQTIRFQDKNHPLSQPGCWAYPDMLEVANGELTNIESRSHFGAWCVVSSPLILGFDLRDSKKMDSVWDIITNMEALAVSQSWEGHPGRLVSQAAQKEIFQVPESGKSMALPSWQVWAKPTATTSQAVLLLNIANTSQSVSIKLSDLGYSSSQKLKVRDIWEHKDLDVMNGDATYSASLEAHDSKFILFTLQ